MSPETPDLPRVPRSLRRAAWALAVVAVLLPVVLLVVHLLVLGGALDARYFSSYEYDENGVERLTVSPDVDFWDRWSILGYTAPVDRVLPAAAAVGVALAGLHLSAGARWPLSRACRWTAAGAAALAVLAAAAVLVVDLVAVQLPEGEGPFFPPTSSFLDVAPTMAAMLVVVVFGAVAAAVLLGPALPRPPAREEPAGPVAEEEPARPDPGPEPQPRPELRPEPRPEPGEVPDSFPRPSADQYAQYRRPPA